jgi:hypothetical protein
MKELSQRANILYRDFNSIPVLIYEDHRFAVNVLYYYYAKTGINNLNAFIFDKHCDLRDVSENSINKCSEIKSFKELFDFVEFDLSEDDNDWVKGAMKLNLIKNYYLFFAQRIINIDEKNYNVEKNHIINYVSNDNIDTIVQNPNIVKEPYFVDFDLDCFSYSVNDKIKAMNFEEIKNHIQYDKYKSFYKQLISGASFISMCFESDFCGGINESRMIFNNINNLFFENKLC